MELTAVGLHVSQRSGLLVFYSTISSFIVLLWLLSRPRLADLILRCRLASESFQKAGVVLEG